MALLSRPGGWSRAVAWTFLALKGAVLAVNAATMPRLRRRGDGEWLRERRQDTSVIIPARDEAANLRRFLPGVLDQGAGEVIVLDDGSRDDTAAVAEALGARVVVGEPLPAGWYGKPHACAQAAAAAGGGTLVFIDADVELSPGALDAVLASLDELGADLLTVMPPAHGLSWGGRVLAPLVNDVVLTWLPYPVLQSGLPRATCANGALIAMRREDYERVGGHRAVRAEILEDQRLAERCKAEGLRVVQVLGQRLVRVRMYDGYRASLRGFAKNTVDVHLGSRPLTVAGAVLHLVTFTLPWCRPARDRTDRALRAATVLERAASNLVQSRTGPADLAEGLLGPLTPLAALPGYVMTLRRVQEWKGRHYRREK